MCLVLTCGETEFAEVLKGYEQVTCRCHNCGNWSGHVISRWQWFTVCFIPLVPLSTHRYHDIVCNICHFAEPLENRPDVMSQHPGAGNELQQWNQGGPPGGGGPPQGWGGGPPQGWAGGSPPPGPKNTPNMQYR